MLGITAGLLFFLSPAAAAQAPQPLGPIVPPTVPTDPKELAVVIANQYGLNVDHFLNVVGCESGWNTSAIGDHGMSHGLVQIFAPAHPSITLGEANDPTFALTFMAKAWSNGDAGMWSCARILGYL